MEGQAGLLGRCGMDGEEASGGFRLFFIFIFKKYKISKIYGSFKKFQKWAPIAHGEGDRPPVAQAGGDRSFL